MVSNSSALLLSFELADKLHFNMLLPPFSSPNEGRIDNEVEEAIKEGRADSRKV
jgi:hypothetical protein